MEKSIFPWHEDAWRQLQAFGDRLPHALLFHGPAGTGKTRFADAFAQALLCEKPAAGEPDSSGHACGVCASCGWFSQYSHPDFRRVRPEILEEGDDADGEAEDADTRKTARSAKAPSKDIRIDQIRALADFMNVSTHRQGKRVVLMYPAEALNAASANALLKTLEEPPPNTVFLLVSNSLDRLLPTILSRCRKFALPMPSADQALAWLKTQGVADAESLLAQQGGAPLAAQDWAHSDAREAMEDFVRQLAHPGIETALKTAERLQKAPVVPQVECLQRWLYDLFCYKLSGKIRYYPRYSKEISSLSARVELDRLLDAVKAASERRAIADHPLSPRLFIEDMLLAYSRLF